MPARRNGGTDTHSGWQNRELTMYTTDDLKSQAKRLRKHFSSQGISLTHSQSLEAIAAVHGHKDWNVASAALASHSKDSMVVTPELFQHLDAMASQGQAEAIANQDNQSAAWSQALQANSPTSLPLADDEKGRHQAS